MGKMIYHLINKNFYRCHSYGMALNNDGTSNDGYMKCKLGGSFVGEYLCISISLVKLIDIDYTSNT